MVGWLFRCGLGAISAVRAAAAGMSREQIRDVYEAELDARGLEIPIGKCLTRMWTPLPRITSPAFVFAGGLSSASRNSSAS